MQPDHSQVRRNLYTNNSTGGEWWVDDEYVCFTMEPPSRKQDGKIVCIPAGTYEVVLYDSPHFGRKVPLLLNVPGHDYVEWHPGSLEGAINALGVQEFDSHDCCLVGSKRVMADFIGDSKITFENVVMPIMERKLSQGRFWVTYLG